MSILTKPLHPGEVLKELYLDPMNMSSIALAKHLNLPRTRIERLVKGQTSMTVDTAAHLAKAFGTSVQYWMNMQTNFDIVYEADRIDVSDVTPLVAA